jgi:hypothetical protein
VKRARPVAIMGATTAMVGSKSGLLERLGASLILRAGYFAMGQNAVAVVRLSQRGRAILGKVCHMVPEGDRSKACIRWSSSRWSVRASLAWAVKGGR